MIQGISCKHPPWFGLVPSPPCQAIIGYCQQPALYDIHNSRVPNAWLADYTLSNRTRSSRAALVHKRLETEAPGQDHHEASADHPRASLRKQLPASTRYTFVARRWAPAMVPPLPPRKLWPERGEPAETLKFLYPLLYHHHPLPESPNPFYSPSILFIPFINYITTLSSFTPL